MRIKLFRSATVGVYSGSKSILMDPWLEDGEYMGSWSHFPQYNLDKSINEINSFDAIYISHIHPDHCSDATMKKISKTIPIYIHSYHAKFLKLKLQRLGFNVFELKHGVRNKIFKDFYITIYAADDCNPELCYRYFGCADLSLKETNSLQIDSLAVIDNNKNTIVNVNDCSFELSKNVINKINQKFEKIDVLLHGYCGAGPYPQCFENLDNNQKILAGKKKENYFLKQGLSFIKEFKPKFYCLLDSGCFNPTINKEKVTKENKFNEKIFTRIKHYNKGRSENSVNSTFILPLQAAKENVEKYNFFENNKIIYLNMLSFDMADYIPENLEISAGIPFSFNVLPWKICIAILMGFKKIYLIGAEQDMYINDTHFIKGDERQKGYLEAFGFKYEKNRNLYPNTSNYISMHLTKQILKSHLNLKKFATSKKSKIINLTPGGILDIYENEKYENVV